MNFKKFYINGNRFSISIQFNTEMYWNDFMGFLTKKTTIKSISECITKQMQLNYEYFI